MPLFFRLFILAAVVPLTWLTANAARTRRPKPGSSGRTCRRPIPAYDIGAAFDRVLAAFTLRETERDRAEAARRAGQAQLARLLALMPAGVIEFDVEGRVTYANAAAERILGAEPGVMVGRRYDDPAWQVADINGVPIPSDRLPCAWALRGEVVMDYEHAVRALDGRQVVVLTDMVPVRDEAGQLEGTLAAFQDVTARQKAVRDLRDSEERLQNSEARFRQLTDLSPSLVWYAQPNGTLSYLNRTWYDYTGHTPEQALPLGWTNAIHPDDRGPLLRAWDDALVREGFYDIEARLRRHDGVYRWFLMRAQPLRAGAGQEVTGWLGSTSDIDDRKRAELVLQDMNAELERRVEARTAELMAAEASLRQSQKMEAVGQLTGGIAHDFNNMLQAIGGSLELMRRRVGQGRTEEAARLVETASKTVERAAALTHRLLAFARRQALQPQTMNLTELIGGLEDLLRRTVGPAITVELRLDDAGSFVLCDPNQLESVLLNLAINARDAMPDGGRLVISTQPVRLSAADIAKQNGANASEAAPGTYIELAVADTGTGMDETTRARAFEPFFTTKPLGQGTGLGLSQLYGFMQQSSGVVRLDSAPGQGTTVRLYLPQHVPALPAQAPPVPAPDRAGAGGSIMLVEDEGEVRSQMSEHLRELGYSVMDAPDGASALHRLGLHERPDMLVTDVGLPGTLNGRQVADAVRERWPDLPVLFITGYAGSAWQTQLAPGMEVISKPFTLDHLATKVRSILHIRP